MLLQLTGCLTKKEDTDATQTVSVIPAAEDVDTSSEQSDSTYSKYSYEVTADPNYQREPFDSPFEFPYDKDGMAKELREYAEEIGMISDSRLSPDEATSMQLVKSREAVNGRVLITSCLSAVDAIRTLARSRGTTANDIIFNVTITESTEYECEYDIIIFAKY